MGKYDDLIGCCSISIDCNSILKEVVKDEIIPVSEEKCNLIKELITSIDKDRIEYFLDSEWAGMQNKAIDSAIDALNKLLEAYESRSRIIKNL